MMMAQGLNHGSSFESEVEAKCFRTKIAQGDTDTITYTGQPQLLNLLARSALLCLRVNILTSFP